MEHAHYCFKCRANTKLANVEVRTSKNNRQVAVGSCTQCTGRVSRFLRRPQEEGDNAGPPPQRTETQAASTPDPTPRGTAAPKRERKAPSAPKPPAAEPSVQAEAAAPQPAKRVRKAATVTPAPQPTA